MVPHPTAKSHVKDAIKPLGVAEKEEGKMCEKHKLFAQNRGATMVAYVIESYGGMGKQARSFNLVVANYAGRTSSVYTRDELLQSIFSEISVEIHEGNRRIVETALQQATKLRRPTFPSDEVVLHAKTLSLRPTEPVRKANKKTDQPDDSCWSTTLGTGCHVSEIKSLDSLSNLLSLPQSQRSGDSIRSFGSPGGASFTSDYSTPSTFL